ncbi:hypothetical protein [Actinomadura macrotermitis]|nr:hypothetical protein [Actinomadura macrotermitis]
MSQSDEPGPGKEPAGGTQPPENDPKQPAEPQAPERSGPGDAPEPPDEGFPSTEEDALRALGDGDDTGRPAQHAQYMDIIKQIVGRYAGADAGPSIGTLALFQDSVEFAGDLNAGAGPRPRGRADSRIDLSRHGAHLAAFVEPPHFPTARNVLTERHLLVLTLPPGTGREALVYNLLARLPDGAGPVECRLLSDTTDLSAPGWRPKEEDRAFVVDLDGVIEARAEEGGLSPDRIDERWIHETAAALRAARSYMIVLTGPARGALLEIADHSSHVLTGIGRVHPMRIVERRVLGTSHTRDQLTELHGRLAACGGEELLRECTEPRIAARLADAVKDGRDLDGVVRELRDPTGEVHRRLSRYREPEHVAFALAAAVLEGAGYLTVSDAALDLYARLVPEEQAPPLSRLRFRDRLGAEQAWIEVAVPRGGGPQQAPRVRFRRPLVQQAVLEYAWTYLDSDRPAFVSWLRRLVTHPDVEVRARAAVAAGVLAGTDPVHALHRFVRPWALDGSPVLRQAAATVLDLLGGRPGLADEIWELLEEWAAESGTGPAPRRLALAAGTAAGGIMGRRDPDRALRVLRTALDREDWATLPTVALSVLHLVELGRTAQVLTALLEWSAPQDTSPLVTKTLSAFVFAATEPAPEIGRVARGEGGARSRLRLAPASDKDAKPLLLTGTAAHRTPLVELWARSLARKPVQTQALARLRRCLETYAGDDMDVRSGMRDLILSIAALPGQHHQRLTYHLQQWARDRERPNEAAKQIHAALARSTPPPPPPPPSGTARLVLPWKES